MDTEADDECPKIVTVGASFIDLVSYAPRFPNPGETIQGTKYITGFGGKGASPIIAAAKLGASTAMIGRLGGDKFGLDYMKNFIDNGVNVEHMSFTDGCSTGTANIMVSSAGENCIIIVPGANSQVSPEDVTAAKRLISSASVLISQLEIPVEATLEAMRIARQHGVLTIMNAAPAQRDVDAQVYQLTDIMCVNESELEVMTGVAAAKIDDARRGALILLRRGCKAVVVTLGKEGAIYVTVEDPNKLIHVATNEKVKVVDTTGAGDAFVGSFAYFLAYRRGDMPIERMIKNACYIASDTVQRDGCQLSYRTRSELPDHLFA